MNDGQHFHRVVNDPVDQNIVGMQHRLAGSRDASGSMQAGMAQEPFGGRLDEVGQSGRGEGVILRDVFDDPPNVVARPISPDELDHQRALGLQSGRGARPSPGHEGSTGRARRSRPEPWRGARRRGPAPLPASRTGRPSLD